MKPRREAGLIIIKRPSDNPEAAEIPEEIDELEGYMKDLAEALRMDDHKMAAEAFRAAVKCVQDYPDEQKEMDHEEDV